VAELLGYFLPESASIVPDRDYNGGRRVYLESEAIIRPIYGLSREFNKAFRRRVKASGHIASENSPSNRALTGYLGWEVYVAKLIVDMLLSLASCSVERTFVFRKAEE